MLSMRVAWGIWGWEMCLLFTICAYYSQEEEQAGTRKPMREAKAGGGCRERSGEGKNMGGEELMEKTWEWVGIYIIIMV